MYCNTWIGSSVQNSLINTIQSIFLVQITYLLITHATGLARFRLWRCSFEGIVELLANEAQRCNAEHEMRSHHGIKRKKKYDLQFKIQTNSRNSGLSIQKNSFEEKKIQLAIQFKKTVFLWNNSNSWFA